MAALASLAMGPLLIVAWMFWDDERRWRALLLLAAALSIPLFLAYILRSDWTFNRDLQKLNDEPIYGRNATTSS